MYEASDELVRTRYACYLNALGKMADAQLELAAKSQIIFGAYKVQFKFILPQLHPFRVVVVLLSFVNADFVESG